MTAQPKRSTASTLGYGITALAGLSTGAALATASILLFAVATI